MCQELRSNKLGENLDGKVSQSWFDCLTTSDNEVHMTEISDLDCEEMLQIHKVPKYCELIREYLENADNQNTLFQNDAAVKHAPLSDQVRRKP